MSTEASTGAPLFPAREAYALALIGGILYAISVPGIGVWQAAFIAQVPLMLAIHGQSPKRAALCGVINGFVGSAVGFYWLYEMMVRFGELPAPLAALLTALMCLYQSGRATMASWLTVRAQQRGWPFAAVFVLAFLTSELVWPLLFPWYFAFTLEGAPILWQTADLGGVYLVGAVLLGSNVAVFEILRARQADDKPSRITIALGAGALLAGLLYGVVREKQIAAREEASERVLVGIAQGNLPLMERSEGIGIHRRLTNKLVEQGAQLVVWPEGAAPDTFEVDAYREEVKNTVTRDLGVPLIFGTGVRDIEGSVGREKNTAIVADADGTVVGRYDKQILLPFGEYMPFGDTFPWLYEQSPNSGRMTPGRSLDPLVLNGHRITALMCYEDILPDLVNRMVNHGDPELLVNMTIDTWFGRTIEPWEHLALAQIRSVEHRRYLVRATNSGVSAIVDARGRVTKKSSVLFDEDAFTGEVRLMRSRTVYETLGDRPFWAGAALAVAMAFIRRRRRDG